MQNELNQELMQKVDQLSLNGDEIEEIITEDSWMDRIGLDLDGLCGAIETIVFMSDKPVGLTRLKKVIDENIPLKIVHEAIQKLQADYEKKHHGIRLVEVAEGYQFRTKAVYSRFVQDLFKITGLTLTPSCLEVLAIIAYRQPVSKFDVEKIRGVDSSHLIRTLMDKRLVKLLGRSDDMGRPSIYGTTSEFLDVFNLPDLSALPPEYELESIIESKTVDINQISGVRNSSKENFIFDDIDELEELASKIRSVSTSTNFTTQLKTNLKSGEASKNAFELLENHIEERLINQAMFEASESDSLGVPDEISILSDLLGSFANAPHNDEDFEMIDLDTGETIKSLENVNSHEVSNASNLDETTGLVTTEEEGIVFDAKALFEDDGGDLKDLESALDEAFDKFKSSQKNLSSDDSSLEIDEAFETSKSSETQESLQDLDKPL